MAFLFIQGVVLSDVLYFFGNLPEDLFASTESLLKHADAFEATLINVRVNSARRNQVDDENALTLLAVAVNATNPLLNTHRIPRQVVIHNAIAELVVQTLTTNLREQQDIESIAVLARLLKQTPQFNALLIWRPSVDHGDAHTIRPELLVKIVQRVTKAAEQHDLVVVQGLLLLNDCTQCLQLWIAGIKPTCFLKYTLDLGSDRADSITWRDGFPIVGFLPFQFVEPAMQNALKERGQSIQTTRRLASNGGHHKLDILIPVKLGEYVRLNSE